MTSKLSQADGAPANGDRTWAVSDPCSQDGDISFSPLGGGLGRLARYLTPESK